jgi:hypothetical protein
MHNNSTQMHRIKSNQQILIIFCLSIAIIVSLASNANLGLASPENKTLMQPQGTQNMSTTTNSTLSYWSMEHGQMDLRGAKKFCVSRLVEYFYTALGDCTQYNIASDITRERMILSN